MRALVASVVLSLLVLAGCGDDDAPVATASTDPTTTTTGAAGPADPEQARLDEARRRWDAAGPDDYRLTWTVQCFCPRTTFVGTIVDGEVVSHEQAPESDALDDGEVPSAPDLDPTRLTVAHPCGQGFQIGSRDQQVALLFRPAGGEPAVAGQHVLPDGSWTGTVRLGRDLFANWCDDVLEAGEPTPDGQRVPIGDITIENPNHGLVAG